MKTLINDGQNLTGAKPRHGTPLAVYDDGFGPLFIHRDSMGISGIVRAQTWEDAYEICEDEFFPSGDEDAAKDYAELSALPEGDERDHAQACWDEAYGYRGSARKEEDGTLSHIYAKDLNGERLDALTPELLAELEITLEIETPDSVKWENTPDGFTDYRLPDCWASALINGDESGLEPSDVEALNAFLEKEKPGQCVECSSESEFSKSNDAGTLAGNVLTFRFQNPSK